MERWTTDKAKAWERGQPYLVGANFIPSTAINQLEMWQAETFDPETLQRELGFAAKLGMNVMRVFLHDLLWEHDRAGFCARIEQYLQIASGRGIRTLFVIFDNCWNATFALGPQPAPKPFTHNSGWVQSPGARIVLDATQWPRIERYVKELLARFRDDSRILGWDLYNEPGNVGVGGTASAQPQHAEGSLPLLRAVFAWARSIEGLSQPLTVGAWNTASEFRNVSESALCHSDIISFHDYGPAQQLADRIRQLAAYGRPMLCTEYMARGAGSTFEHCLPVMRKHNVGAINWGLVAGKTQTIYPWGWNAERGEPDILFHDIFRTDGSFLYPAEEQAIRRMTCNGRSV